MKIKSGRNIISIALALVLMLSLFCGCSNNEVDADNTVDSANTDNAVVTDEMSEKAAVELSEEEISARLDRLVSAYERILASPLIFNVQDSEETYNIFMTNSSGEIFSQRSDASSITVYRNDHKAINYAEYISFGSDTEILSIMKSALALAKEGNVDVLGFTDEYNLDAHTNLVVDIRGWDMLGELYSYIGDDFEISIVEQFKLLRDQVIESGAYDIEPEDEMNLRFMLVSNDEHDWVESAACYIYFGDTPAADITYDDLMLSWVIEGISATNDWNLLEGWYTTDWTQLATWEDLTPAEELLTSQFVVLEEVMKAFADEHGLDLEADTESVDGEVMDENSGSTENVEGENGHYHEDGTWHSDSE